MSFYSPEGFFKFRSLWFDFIYFFANNLLLLEQLRGIGLTKLK